MQRQKPSLYLVTNHLNLAQDTNDMSVVGKVLFLEIRPLL
jgi:hypothetical protein